MSYDKQVTRVLSSYVNKNKKLIPFTAGVNSLYDATFLIRVGQLIKLAEQHGILKSLFNIQKLEASFSVMAVTSDEFIDALKYFAIISYALEFGKNPNIPTASIKKWEQSALTVFASFKINLKRPIAKISNLISNPNTKYLNAKEEPTTAYSVLTDQTKIIRDTINPKKSKVLADPAATANLRSFFANVFTYFNSKSEPSFRAITQNIRYLNDPKLSSLLHVTDEQIDNSAIKKYLNWIAKKTNRKNPDYLTKEEVEGLSAKDAEIHKQLRLDHNKAYKAKLQDIIRNSGKPHLPATQLKKHLTSEGFPAWGIPKGFTGNVDEKGALYTHTGLPLDKGQAGGTMEMNPDWSPANSGDYYAKGRSNFATTDKHQYFFTLEHVKNARNDKKQKNADQLEEKLPAMQKAWRKDLKSGTEGEKLMGAMVEAIYQTQARIGGASETGARGLTTWLNKDVKTNAAGNLIITYPAKSGMIQKHVIRGDAPEKVALIRYILDLKEGKRPTDPIWVTKNNLTADAGLIRRYLKSMGFEGKPHSFRHLAGNQVWDKLITEKPLKKAKPTPKEVDNYYKWITNQVGQILGHQRTVTDKKTGQESTVSVGGTAATSYIDPQRQVKLFKDKGVPVPKKIERIAKDLD